MINFNRSIVIFILATAGAVYSQGVIYSEDFQGYASGASNFVGSGNGWTGAGMGVSQTNTIGGVGSFFSTETPKRSLFVNDTTTNIAGSQLLIYSSTNAGATSISNRGNITIRFDYNVRTNDNQTPTFDLRAGNTWVATLNFLSAIGSFRNFTGGIFQEVAPFSGISTANWYRVEIAVGDLSTTNDTYSLKVWEASPSGGYDQPGVLVVNVSDIPFRADASYIDGFDFRTIGSTRSIIYNIDNILVKEPPRVSLIVISN